MLRKLFFCYDWPMLLATLFLLPLLLQGQQSELTPGKNPPSAEDPLHPKTTIVVTATRTETEPEKSPVSTGLVDRQEIETRNQQVLDQTLDLTEGVYANRGKGVQDTQAGVGMRGFSGRGSSQARTLILLDGQPLNDGYTGQLSWATLPIGEVDRVEVARGPFSSLYGGNAMGGVVNILTRPVSARELEFTGERGSQDTSIYGFRFSDRLWNRLGVTLGYQRMQSGGYPTNGVFQTATAGTAGTPVTGAIPFLTTTNTQTFQVGDTGNNWWNQHAYRLRGDYSLNEKTVFTVQYIRQRSGYGYDGGNTFLRDANGAPVFNGTVVFPFNGISRRLAITPFRFLSGDGGAVTNFVNAKVYRTVNARTRFRAGFGTNHQPESYFSTPATVANTPSLISDRPARSYFGDFQWSQELNSRHALVFGTDWRKDGASISEFNVPDYARRFAGRQQSYAASGNSINPAAYIQDSWRATERLLIVFGGRFDYWRTYDGQNDSFGTGLAASRYATRSSRAFTGKVAALYQLPWGINIRASVANAFRNPTVFDLYRTWRAASGTLFVSNPNLRPERLKSWEAGVRKSFGARVAVDTAVYENRIENLIYRVTDFAADPTGLTRPVTNAAQGFTRGFEFGATENLLPWLKVRQTYTYSDARIESNPLIPNTEGKRVPNVPRNMATFGLLGAKSRFSGAVTGRYVGTVFNTDTNTDIVKGVPGAYDPYFEMDFNAGVQITRNVTATFTVDNLLDRIYYTFTPSPGRMVYAGLRVRFGRSTQ